MTDDSPGAALDPDEIGNGAGLGPVGRRVLVFRDTASTNDLALRLGEDGEPEGTVVFAETQTAGRGQFRREWHSAGGLGLWFSILLRPRWPPAQIAGLTPLAAVAICDAIAATTGLRPRIKRPNDLFAGARKLAGILTEVRSGATRFAVVGIGVNVNHTPADFPIALRESATSLAIELGRPAARAAVATAILEQINRRYDPARAPADEILARYEALSRPAICANF